MSPSRLKERVLEQVGDEGADMIDRVWSQIEYTAYWCIRMLHDSEGISAVAPEAGDDVVVERAAVSELRQVKTRDESQGTWSIADVIDILCGQYRRRHAHRPPILFIFVSNAGAHPDGTISTRTYGPLHRLKMLLDEQRERPPLSPEDQIELDAYMARLAPEVADRLTASGDTCDAAAATSLLLSTVIETNTTWLREAEEKNLVELNEALAACLPGTPPARIDTLRRIYERLLGLIVRRIRRGLSISERRIDRAAVLECREEQGDTPAVDLAALPGRTVLEKKLLRGGFHPTELSAIGRQKILSEAGAREMTALGLGRNVAFLSEALLDRQLKERRRLASDSPNNQAPGPLLLERLRSVVRPISERFFDNPPPHIEQLALGLLWQSTSQCFAWWDLIGLATPSSSTNRSEASVGELPS